MNNIHTSKHIPSEKHIDGKEVAKYFKYYLQFNNGNTYQISLNRVGYKVVYSRNKAVFDAAASLFVTYNVDIINYVKWFVLEQHYGIKDIKYKFLDCNTINSYATFISIKQNRKIIFKRFNSCAYNIANECINNKLFHCVDYIKMLVQDKKLAVYYITGKINKYFLAAIPTCQKLIDKLDPLSQDEFSQIYKMFDVYHREIIEAMQQELGKIVGPFAYVDKIIDQKLTKCYH